MPKIAILGAAASSFSGVLADIVSSTVMDGCSVALVDIDAEGLDIMTRLGKRMAKQWKKKTKVTGTTDRRMALKGADFVLTTIAVGGLTTWRQDEEIPAKHGFYGCSVDTTGPGGLMRGLRLIHPLIDICKDVAAICPDAWIINYSNPMPAICRAVRKAVPQVNIAGLCTAGFLPRQVARYLNIDASRAQVISGGMNHCVWAKKFIVDGKDVTKDFHAHVRKTQSKGYARSSVELLDLFDIWPMPGANHVAEYFPYFYGNEPDGRAEKYPYRKEHDFDARLKRDIERRADLKAQAHGKKRLGGKPEESGAEAVRMFWSIWTDGRTLHYANVENNGIIPNLRPEAIVEVPVICDMAGVRGLPVGPLPESMVGFVQQRVAYFELLADAAIQQSKHVALQCLMNDCNTTSFVRARACLDEMFKVQGKFLKGYK
jgi:alpha-galactosidase